MPACGRGASTPRREAAAVRFHQRVRPWSAGAAPGSALLGFACDAGVIRNQGRPGAADGPVAIRRALASLAWHATRPLWDAGDVVCEDDALEAAQAELGAAVAALLGEGQLAIVLGGGHEVAHGSFLGLAAHAARSAKAPVIGVLNVDAHLDLRTGPRGTSGTPFRRNTPRPAPPAGGPSATTASASTRPPTPPRSSTPRRGSARRGAATGTPDCTVWPRYGPRSPRSRRASSSSTSPSTSTVCRRPFSPACPRRRRAGSRSRWWRRWWTTSSPPGGWRSSRSPSAARRTIPMAGPPGWRRGWPPGRRRADRSSSSEP